MREHMKQYIFYLQIHNTQTVQKCKEEPIHSCFLYSLFLHYFLINTDIFDYPDSRLSDLDYESR